MWMWSPFLSVSHSCHGAGSTYNVETLDEGMICILGRALGGGGGECWELSLHYSEQCYLKFTNCSLLRCSIHIFSYGNRNGVSHPWLTKWNCPPCLLCALESGHTDDCFLPCLILLSSPTPRQVDPCRSPSFSLGCLVPPLAMMTNHMARGTSFPPSAQN